MHSQITLRILNSPPSSQGYVKTLAPFICDTVVLLHQAITSGKKILAEGANGALVCTSIDQ